MQYLRLPICTNHCASHLFKTVSFSPCLWVWLLRIAINPSAFRCVWPILNMKFWVFKYTMAFNSLSILLFFYFTPFHPSSILHHPSFSTCLQSSSAPACMSVFTTLVFCQFPEMCLHWWGSPQLANQTSHRSRAMDDISLLTIIVLSHVSLGNHNFHSVS